MLTVLTFRWGTKYHADYVNILAAAVARNLSIPHRFVCVTDDPAGLDGGIEAVPLWDDHAGRGRCWRRLKMLSRDFAGPYGDILHLDLDTVVTGDITPLAAAPVPVAIWKCPSLGSRSYALNPSLMLVRGGCLDWLWREFDAAPDAMIARARAAGYTGSDQGVIGLRLDGRVTTWGMAEGVYGYRDEARVTLPAGTRLVGFYGRVNPPAARARHAWIREHWRC